MFARRISYLVRRGQSQSANEPVAVSKDFMSNRPLSWFLFLGDVDLTWVIQEKEKGSLRTKLCIRRTESQRISTNTTYYPFFYANETLLTSGNSKNAGSRLRICHLITVNSTSFT